MRKLVCILLVLVCLSLLVNCNTSEQPEYWPTEEWQTSTPEEQGMDSEALKQITAYIADNNLAIDSVVVIRHGYIVFEEYPAYLYDEETPHIVHSITKSIVSSLIGIAIREGYIDGINQKMIDLFPERDIQNVDTRKERVTLEHILKMKAGLEWEEWRYAYTDPRNDYIRAIFSADPVQYVLNLPMENKPGVEWDYNGGTSHLLSALISEATGYDTLEFAREFLFDPLRITDVSWHRDRHGIYYGGGELYLKPRDMVKIGYLYLHGGEWDGRQIVPADFVAEAVTTHHYFSESTGYGYQSWWTYPQDGVYYSAGLYGQRIYVIPDNDIVVVITTSMNIADPEDWLYPIVLDYIIAACE